MKLTQAQRDENAAIAQLHLQNKTLPADPKPSEIIPAPDYIPRKRVRNRTSSNFQFLESPLDGENPVGISETIPDQALSLKELLQRHTRGLAIPMRQPIYSDLDIPDMEKLDLTERQELAEQNRDRIADIRRDLQRAEERKRARKTGEKGDKNPEKGESNSDEPKTMAQPKPGGEGA